jgi:tRNA(Ile)-lysidine synthase
MILETVKSTIRKYNLIQRGDKIVAGVSGGPDSVALLFLLNSLKQELKIDLHIAHLNHMLREDSYKDEEFVQMLANRLKIPLASTQINIKEIAKKGSLEEIARNARLGFFFRVAKDVKAKKIALGHNLDDQAETVLMRILRGTGLYGLSGILPKRNIAGFTIIRPLIEVKRKEIEVFLKKRKINPRIDISNKEDIFFRNKIRNKLLPHLEKEYNKNIKEILANMAESVAFDYDYLSYVAERAIRGAETRINMNKLMKFHTSIRRLVIRRAIARRKGDTRRITFQHTREIEDLILNRPINSIVDLPGGISVVKQKYLYFYPRKPSINT